jgi:hypothetical protein
LKGQDLLNGLRTREYTEALVAQVIRQVLEAVAYVHQRDLSHNQINPFSIYFINTASYEIKVGGLDEVGLGLLSIQNHID